MESKKNPKVDLARNSGLYFAIGLCLVLFLSWKLVEYKSYDKSTIDIGMLNVADDEIEDVPLTEQLKTPPPPPPPAVVTQVLEVVKDEEDLEETVIESTETTQEEIIEDVEVMRRKLRQTFLLPLLKMFRCFQVVSGLKNQSAENAFNKRWTST